MELHQKIQFIIELHGVIFGLIMLVALYRERPKFKTPGFVLMEVMVAHTLEVGSDMLCLVYDGSSTARGLYINYVANLTLYISQFVLAAVMASYVDAVLRKHKCYDGYKFYLPVFVITTLGVLGTILTQFTGFFYTIDSCNVYHRGPLFLVSMGLGALAMLVMLIAILVYRDSLETSEMVTLLFYLLAPETGLIIQSFITGFSFMNIGISIAIFGVFIGYEMAWRKERREQEKKLIQSQAYLLNSQIQPHFVFNALNTIQALIAEDPDTAEEAVTHFAKYLRKSLNLKVNESLIPVQEEMEYVTNYLYLEKLRFGSQLQVKWILDDDLDMKVPFLSIQPLVENAIRHGIRKKPGGGTVTISIQNGRRWNTIQVIDDGAGVDVKKMYENPDPNSNGVGLKNVEDRIRLLCNGMLSFHSEPGKGTIVSIYIPKEIKNKPD